MKLCCHNGDREESLCCCHHYVIGLQMGSMTCSAWFFLSLPPISPWLSTSPHHLFQLPGKPKSCGLTKSGTGSQGGILFMVPIIYKDKHPWGPQHTTFNSLASKLGTEYTIKISNLSLVSNTYTKYNYIEHMTCSTS